MINLDEMLLAEFYACRAPVVHLLATAMVCDFPQVLERFFNALKKKREQNVSLGFLMDQLLNDCQPLQGKSRLFNSICNKRRFNRFIQHLQ